MSLLESQVHSSLRDFLREQDRDGWPHHLTMARLVARALRLGRSALMQTGSPRARYCLSYLTPALLSRQAVLLVVPPELQEQLLSREIPQLQDWLQSDKEIRISDRWPESGSFQGLLLTSPPSWLADRLENQGRFPQNIPTIIDQADDLEEWTRHYLSASLGEEEWEQLRQSYPHQGDSSRDVRVQLTKAIFSRPQNPYECCLLEEDETESLDKLLATLAAEAPLSPAVAQFWQRWHSEGQLLWVAIARATGQFTLHVAPTEVATALSRVWTQQPVVLLGSFLDWEKSAAVYRQQLGLPDLLCLKFSANPQSESIQLYLPEGLPLPNTPAFKEVLLEQVLRLLHLCSHSHRPIVLLVEDVPLKGQVGAILAAEFGSRVQVEKENWAEDTILVSGWQFWGSHQHDFPTPQLLVMATLPLPSLENPLVAGKVAYYKRQRLDWFRLYLLPTALREIQRAVVPLRESQGIVALLDNRVNHRSYGSYILSALEPYAKSNYIDRGWFAG